jgi:hypothetical protein
VVYATIFGKLPPAKVVMSEQGISLLWKRARRMVPDEHELKPFPSLDEAKYLYHIAHRICIKKDTPRSLVIMPTNESVYYTPDDSLYEDLYIYGEMR